ncbi:polysaccharide biosynthesis/export family protein [Sinimarinibacterium sp. NLF-5-8]|uniref:polysaccharide biosynthesis/export family protein n=1 Tax=Sinimarinibacterium sp. NLF-5-8 TaxID=2698684 RepID=UPI00137C34D7|nr:polysaccharide biosynthesis/export family protein [Sinimarinibacterium sp. NLF-5-8]QHS10544.1 polysialic acid transporter [Sinimarinibacterium sp. NLF-5-8]
MLNKVVLFLVGLGVVGAAVAQDASLQAALAQQQSLEARSVESQAPPIPEAVQVDRQARAQGVFGADLFRGRFAAQSFKGFNPDYLVSVGDRIDLKLWGAVDLALMLEVDSQGNIFVPRIGPVQVANVRNGALNALVTQRIQQVYRENVGVYAALAAAEPVKVFVTGYVKAPGLFGAYASDSLLHFLDQAGGIDEQTGSFLDVRILRGGSEVARFSLYDFLLRGQLPLFQFRDGDTIVVWPKKSVATVTGLVRNAAQFEFDGTIALADLLTMAGIDPRATHVMLIKNQTPEREAVYLPVDAEQARQEQVVSGDEVSVFADRQIGSIIAKVEGEYQGLSQYSLPYASHLGDLLQKVQTTERSNLQGLQLYRKSVAVRQKQVLDQMLRKLEEAVLNTRASSVEEATLRVREAELVMKFVERARTIEPRGQLVLQTNADLTDVALEDQDVIRIPRQANTVAVQGEVFFPTAFVHVPGKGLKYYLEQAGGLTQNANKSKIFIMHPNGEMVEASLGWGSGTELAPGDEIMVLPKVDSKKFQLTKDLVQVLYQIALSAGVVLRL